MKVKVYMRFARFPQARKGFYVDAAPTPRPGALTTSSGYELHTLAFALEVNVPDELLLPAKWPVIELDVDEDIVERPPITVEALTP